MAWQPIGTTPKDGTLVDLWVDGERRPDCCWHVAAGPNDTSGWWDKYAAYGDGDYLDWDEHPTHWMQRPEAPLELEAHIHELENATVNPSKGNYKILYGVFEKTWHQVPPIDLEDLPYPAKWL